MYMREIKMNASETLTSLQHCLGWDEHEMQAIESVVMQAVEEEKEKWIIAIETAECDSYEMRVKDHNKKIFKVYENPNLITKQHETITNNRMDN